MSSRRSPSSGPASDFAQLSLNSSQPGEMPAITRSQHSQQSQQGQQLRWRPLVTPASVAGPTGGRIVRTSRQPAQQVRTSAVRQSVTASSSRSLPARDNSDDDDSSDNSGDEETRERRRLDQNRFKIGSQRMILAPEEIELCYPTARAPTGRQYVHQNFEYITDGGFRQDVAVREFRRETELLANLASRDATIEQMIINGSMYAVDTRAWFDSILRRIRLRMAQVFNQFEHGQADVVDTAARVRGLLGLMNWLTRPPFINKMSREHRSNLADMAFDVLQGVVSRDFDLRSRRQLPHYASGEIQQYNLYLNMVSPYRNEEPFDLSVLQRLSNVLDRGQAEALVEILQRVQGELTRGSNRPSVVFYNTLGVICRTSSRR